MSGRTVLYEMLTGERAFRGEDVSDTLVSVFRDEPDWAKLPADIPPRIPQAMRVCLQKDAKRRVRDIAAVRLAMEGAFETEVASFAGPVEFSRWTRALPAMVVVLAGLVVGLTVWVMTHRDTAGRAVSRTSIFLPKTQRPSNMGRRGIAASPTGTHIAYTANRQLYVRAMDEVDAKRLRGADGSNPTLPFFSPDGQWIGFYSQRDDELAKIATSDGAAVTLCSVGRPNGASWGSDGTFVFGLAGSGILQVSEDGGEPEVLLAVDPESGALVQSPQILPDGRTVLFTLARNNWTQAQVVAQSLDTGERRVLVEDGSDARYLATGHLVYASDGNLLAVPFDPDRLDVTGGPIPIVESVRRANVSVAMHFDISRDGMLVYLPGTGVVLRTLVWLDRDGREEPIAAEPSAYRRARISPDGTKAVLDLNDEEQDLWIWDFARETLTRLTFDPGEDRRAEWTPDGAHVVFTSGRDGVSNLYQKAVDGTGGSSDFPKAPLANSQERSHPMAAGSWSSTSPEITNRFDCPCSRSAADPRLHHCSTRVLPFLAVSFLPMAVGSRITPMCPAP